MREAVEKKVLSENDRLAAAPRQRYRDEGILCVNLVSAPGSGKTMLLEKTLATFPNDTAVAVLTGDLQTDNSHDLREAAKTLLLNVTEGEDKPLKYPGIFHRSTLMILTKTDLLPHREFNGELALENARKIHLEIDTTVLSARNGEGLDLRLAWLGALQQKVQHQTAAAIT
jgi:hydrogenase nickel incorporation protein HypB